DRAGQLAVDEAGRQMPQEIGDQRPAGQLLDQARDLLADARQPGHRLEQRKENGWAQIVAADKVSRGPYIVAHATGEMDARFARRPTKAAALSQPLSRHAGDRSPERAFRSRPPGRDGRGPARPLGGSARAPGPGFVRLGDPAAAGAARA